MSLVIVKSGQGPTICDLSDEEPEVTTISELSQKVSERSRRRLAEFIRTLQQADIILDDANVEIDNLE